MSKNRGFIFGMLFLPFVLVGALATACCAAYRMGSFMVIDVLRADGK